MSVTSGKLGCDSFWKLLKPPLFFLKVLMFLGLFFASFCAMLRFARDMLCRKGKAMDVRDVAKWFLSKSAMTHKKLQKLCYYAQAWHYTLLNEALFSDEIEAWVHGPVIPALYKIYADYGWQEIPQGEKISIPVSEKTLEVLDAVWNTYNDLNGDQLEALTHKETPWIKARGDLNPLDICHNAIALEDMKSFYGEKYKEAQND